MLSNGVDAANTPDRTAALTTLLDSLAASVLWPLARARAREGRAATVAWCQHRPTGASRRRRALAAADVADFQFSES